MLTITDKSHEPARPPRRVAFVSTMCLLDPTSGAARSVRGILETLAGAGYDVWTYTASVSDRRSEFDWQPILDGPEATHWGSYTDLIHNGVHHRVLRTRSSRAFALSVEEQQQLLVGWREALDKRPTNVVVTYGNSTLSQTMQADARRAGARLILYLANDQVDAAALVRPTDRILCPSQFLAAQYAKAGAERVDVLRPIVDCHAIVPEGLSAATPDTRQLGFVTFVTPMPQKGLSLFNALAKRASRDRKDMMFLVVEGRAPLAALRANNIEAVSDDHVWWLPHQACLRRVFARTSILLAPSFWREGFGRTVVEAQLSGIPVIASTQGGLPEALNGGGVALPIPPACEANHRTVPDEATTDLWWTTLQDVWDDAETYGALSARARPAAIPYAPERTKASVLAYFDESG